MHFISERIYKMRIIIPKKKKKYIIEQQFNEMVSMQHFKMHFQKIYLKHEKKKLASVRTSNIKKDRIHFITLKIGFLFSLSLSLCRKSNQAFWCFAAIYSFIYLFFLDEMESPKIKVYMNFGFA